MRACRPPGILLLALLVGALPRDGVNRQEGADGRSRLAGPVAEACTVRTLTDFFCADSTLAPESLVEACEGLLALAACAAFGVGDTIQVCHACVVSSDL